MVKLIARAAGVAGLAALGAWLFAERGRLMRRSTWRVLREGGYEGDTSQLEYGMPAKWREDVESRVLDSVRALATDIGIAAKSLE